VQHCAAPNFTEVILEQRFKENGDVRTDRPRRLSGKNGIHKHLVDRAEIENQIADVDRTIANTKKTQEPGRKKIIQDLLAKKKHLRLILEQPGETHSILAKGQHFQLRC
jgi:hypothetical protein